MTQRRIFKRCGAHVVSTDKITNLDYERKRLPDFVSLMYYFEGSAAVHWPKPIASSSSAQAVSDLISRVLDGAPTARLFQISLNADLAVNGKDVFVLSNGSTPGSISISASTGVAAAMGFNYYLKYVANSSGRIPDRIQCKSHSSSYQSIGQEKTLFEYLVRNYFLSVNRSELLLMICFVGMEMCVPLVIPLSFGISHGKKINSTISK
jgi:hypothetical protein